MYILEKCYL